MSPHYTDWQIDQLSCECVFHRYHVAHICECGALYSHSQADCDKHRMHDCLSFDPKEYKHGDKARDVFDRLVAAGTVDLFAPAFRKVYDRFAEED